MSLRGDAASEADNVNLLLSLCPLLFGVLPLLFAVVCSLPRVCNRGRVGGKVRLDVGALAAMWRWRIMGRVCGSVYW